ncbi:MAG: glycosyltransferase family 4 protein [Patescibacteria group bacterium]
MKTFLLTLEYLPFKGGVANYYSHLVKYWPSEMTVVTHHDLMKKKYLIPWLAAFFKLKNILKKNPESLILIGQVLPLGTVAWLNYLIKPYKYVVIFHGMDFSFALKSSRKAYLMSKSLKYANKIVCANSYVADLIKKWRPEYESKIVIINPGVDDVATVADPLLLEKYHNHNKVILLSLGRLVKRKGVDKVLEALALLDKEFNDKILYLIAGTGESEMYLKELASKLKTEVIFTGEVSEPEKWALLDLCDIFIMPAREINGDFEGFGIVYLEANLCGKPVIAGRSGGVSDAVNDGESGLLVNPESIQEISLAIKALVINQDERERMGKIGRERALESFKWQTQITKLYNNL